MAIRRASHLLDHIMCRWAWSCIFDICAHEASGEAVKYSTAAVQHSLYIVGNPTRSVFLHLPSSSNIQYSPYSPFSPTFMSVLTASSVNFQSVLDAALDHYVKQTGVDITKHPSADKLQNCHSPEDVIQLLSEGETAFKDYRNKYRNMIDHLRPVVRIVYAFSGILGEAFQPTKAIFVGINVLLSVRISHLCLSHL
jgi:hypothetical protein